MKVFVGTMESGEADFKHCVDAIKQQSCPVFHYVVSGLSEPDAHHQLYEEWNTRRTEYDLFLKVDADTVLAHPYVVDELIQLFSKNSRLTGVQAWLYDHMTHTKIFGLSCIRNTVDLVPSKNPLYPDRVDLIHDIVIRGDSLPLSLNPAGNHCCYANDKQAFRYGLHRAIKGQTEILAQVKNAWLQFNDRTRAFALIGAQYASILKKNLQINYTDLEFQLAF